MSLSSHVHRVFLLICALCLPAIASVPTPPVATTKIRLDERSMILVPVHINGSGPYEFLLDTGATRTMIDQKLADQLHLPTVGAKTLVGVLASAKLTTVPSGLHNLVVTLPEKNTVELDWVSFE